jgi:peroxiredoxin Q/BCP
MAELDTGDLVPDFDLPRAGGGKLGLGDLKGKPFVLYFFPKDGSEGCVNEAVDFSRLKPEFDALGVAVVGVSPDGQKTKEKFRTKNALTVHLLSDEARVLIGPCGVWVEKQMYGRSYMGVERSTILVGPDGKVVKVWRKVRIAGHAEAVLDAARSAWPPS